MKDTTTTSVCVVEGDILSFFSFQNLTEWKDLGEQDLTDHADCLAEAITERGYVLQAKAHGSTANEEKELQCLREALQQIEKARV